MQVTDALGIGRKAVEDRGKASGANKASQKTGGKAPGSAASSGGDRVELSGRSREAAQAREVLAATPSVRNEKVAEIKNRIDNNQYEVDADKVAHKMIMNALGDVV